MIRGPDRDPAILAGYDTKSFTLYQGGKGASPLERTQVRDWGERVQPTQRRLER